LRKNNKNYTVINGVEHKIKNMNALFDLGKDVEYVRNGKLQRSIKLLYRAIDGIAPKDVGNLIEQGKKNFVEWVAQVEIERKGKINRSVEFLENAIRLTGVEKNPKGYLVKGLTGNIYFIDLEQGGVWIVKKKGKKYVNDKYLCIVDSNYGEDEWEINDRIANRILALSKDSVVAPQIWSKNSWKSVLGVPTEMGEMI
jgi:hypothetical protein